MLLDSLLINRQETDSLFISLFMSGEHINFYCLPVTTAQAILNWALKINLKFQVRSVAQVTTTAISRQVCTLCSPVRCVLLIGKQSNVRRKVLNFGTMLFWTWLFDRLLVPREVPSSENHKKFPKRIFQDYLLSDWQTRKLNC